MTVSQLIEALASKLCSIKGHTTDGTLFHPPDINEIKKELREAGFEDSGEEWMHNGRTGKRMKHRIFIAPNYYQRLQKFVANSIYAVSNGPTCMITRQPVGSRKQNGGIRLGEMERDALIGSGALNFLDEKFIHHSDGFKRYICARCGNNFSVIVNVKSNYYHCTKCGDLADIKEVPSTWSSNVLSHEMRALGVTQTYGFAPPIQEKTE
jgi:DNA-directed RNA polymerase beta subunit